MTRTEYAVLTTEELINFCAMKPERTPLETELYQRLESAVDMLNNVYDNERVLRAEWLLS